MLRPVLTSFFSFLLLICTAQKQSRLHAKAVLIDTHNDILTTILTDSVNLDHDLTGKTHSDMDRFKKGGVDVQFFSVWCDGKMVDPFKWANRQIDSLYALVNRNPQRMEIAYNASDIKRILKAKKIAAMIGVEGGHMMENDLSKIDSLFQRGTRYMTLTWNNSTPWATSAMYENSMASLANQPATSSPPEVDSVQRPGLNEFGKNVVRKMNDLGMIVDVSHVGEQTFWDVMSVTSKPVIASHSSVHALCPVFRNLKDEQIRAIAKNDGVVCINFYSGFIDSNFSKRNRAFNLRHKEERDSIRKTVTDDYFADVYLFQKYADEVRDLRPPLSMLMDHIDHVVRLVGVNHVGIGSDFDGVNSLPQGLEGVQDFPKITNELRKRGYSKSEIKKILGENVLRVLKANE